MPVVALVTCAALPELDEDDRLVLAPLAALGIDVTIAVWDDPSVDWSSFDLVVSRNPWDYPEKLDAFRAWAASVPRLRNPAQVLAWNTDKSYLGELAAAGLPVVETAFLAPGDPLPALEGEVVAKPTVSSGSRDAERFTPDRADAFAAHVDLLHAAGRTVMVQPYLAKVEGDGETAMLHLGGEYSHAIRKGAMLNAGRAVHKGLYVIENIEPREPSAAEREVAAAVMEVVRARFGSLLYARVDLLLGEDGDPVLLELEVTEPSLFLGKSAGAPERFAAAIAAELGAGA